MGRPSIPPEQLFSVLLGGYLVDVTSERTSVRKLTGNLSLPGLWDWIWVRCHGATATFSQNRTRQVTKSGLRECVRDETVALAIKQKLLSYHTSLGGILAQAQTSYTNVVPIEVFLKPEN